MDALNAFRSWMTSRGYQAAIIPSNDCHFDEYVPARYAVRAYLSGFDGSAGTLVVTATEAALWTDSRYFLQAEKQLAGSGIELMRLKMPGTPTITGWIASRCQAYGIAREAFKVGMDGELLCYDDFFKWADELDPIVFEVIDDPFDELWPGRPAMPDAPIVLHREEYAGCSVRQKYADVVARLGLQGPFSLFISSCDEIMWLLNIRGGDVEYNAVALSYAVLDEKGITLFCRRESLTAEAADYLASQGVEVRGYDEINAALASIPSDAVRIVSGNCCSINKYNLLIAGGSIMPDPTVGGTVAMLRACKNPVQQKGFRRAFLQDGGSWVRLLKHIYDNYDSGSLSEYSITQKLLEIKRGSDNYLGESFEPIVAWNANAASAHYSFTDEASSARIAGGGFLLMDLGSHYPYGTTDTTRTVFLGSEEPTDAQKIDYTLVLKGMIALSEAIFPEGTRGCQLDILARGPMYATGKMFFHGTSHGIGQWLCVHESPQIRMEYSPIALQEGMILSNEPAVYVEGEYGIRTENVILVGTYAKTGYNSFYRFETLTLVPIDRRAVDESLLTEGERAWLDAYNRSVYETLKAHLTEEERAWLAGYIGLPD